MAEKNLLAIKDAEIKAAHDELDGFGIRRAGQAIDPEYGPVMYDLTLEARINELKAKLAKGEGN